MFDGEPESLRGTQSSPKKVASPMRKGRKAQALNTSAVDGPVSGKYAHLTEPVVENERYEAVKEESRRHCMLC